MGNVHGRTEGMNMTSDALLIGSHLVMILAFKSEKTDKIWIVYLLIVSVLYFLK